MSKSELLSDKANSGAAASRLKCAKKVLDIHRQFIDDLMGPRLVWLRVKTHPAAREVVLTCSIGQLNLGDNGLHIYINDRHQVC